MSQGLNEEEILKKWQENPMLRPRIEKVVVNMVLERLENHLRRLQKFLKNLLASGRAKGKLNRQFVISE